MRARPRTQQVQGVRRVVDMRARPPTQPVQGVRRGVDMRARPPTQRVQGVRRVVDMRARPPAQPVQGVRAMTCMLCAALCSTGCCRCDMRARLEQQRDRWHHPRRNMDFKIAPRSGCSNDHARHLAGHDQASPRPRRTRRPPAITPLPGTASLHGRSGEMSRQGRFTTAPLPYCLPLPTYLAYTPAHTAAPLPGLNAMSRFG